MAQTQVLLSVTEVTDCSTGDNQVGELDYSIHVKPFEDYIDRNGYEGKKEIMNMLGTLAANVQEYFRNSQSKKNQGQTEAKR